MTMTRSSEPSGRFVMLAPGYLAPIEAQALLFRLEAAGFRFSITDDNRLRVQPASRLTEADRAALTYWRCAAINLLRYQAEVQ
jgi:hypothetical protein